jgi:peptidoglycan/xylan/chitin deacetylase (PgdA/CDA1 family)
MKRSPGALWQALPDDWPLQLSDCCQKADQQRTETTAVFFRADDIAVPGRQMADLLEIFNRHALPLALAVVPAWLTPPRWQALCAMGGDRPDRWCWHQHGWRHRNHESEGKKQEFGPSRSREVLARDLTLGRERLAAIMGTHLTPLFTPPWNRCSEDTLALLQEMGYKAVSRSRGNRPPAPPGLPDLPVSVDLHTRRAPSAAVGWERLKEDLTSGLRYPTCGIMIHHQRMNAVAFTFLEGLLETLIQHPRLTVLNMRDLIP